MIEFLVGFTVLAVIAWMIWGVDVFRDQLDDWYPFKHMRWYQWVSFGGPVLVIIFLSWGIGWLVIHV